MMTKEDKNKPKQRAIAFTDNEWELLKSAVKESEFRNVTHLVSSEAIKKAKRILR